MKHEFTPILPMDICTIPEASVAGDTEEVLKEEKMDCVVGRARYTDNPRGQIIGEETGFLKPLFRRDDLRLLSMDVVGEQATEVVHIGLMALLVEADEDVFNRACFNCSTWDAFTNTRPTTRFSSIFMGLPASRTHAMKLNVLLRPAHPPTGASPRVCWLAERSQPQARASPALIRR